MALKKQYFAISRPWGSGRPKRKTEKRCAISGRNFWDGRICSPKVPQAPGNCNFVFSARLRKCSRPKRAKIPLNHCFRPVGVRPEKKLLPRKLQKTILDSVVTFFFDFGISGFRDPCCSGAGKGPCGASFLGCCCCCCCLLARRASSTLVP